MAIPWKIDTGSPRTFITPKTYKMYRFRPGFRPTPNAFKTANCADIFTERETVMSLNLVAMIFFPVMVGGVNKKCRVRSNIDVILTIQTEN